MNKSRFVLYFSSKRAIINFVDTNPQEVEEERHHVSEETTPFLPGTLEESAQAAHPRETTFPSFQGW